MSLRTSPEAVKWLKQFDATDLSLAEQLLESLVLIPSSRFQRELIHLVDHFRATCPGRIALYAARKADTPYFEDKRSSPQRVEPGIEIGSEGQIAQIITNLSRLDSRFLDHPPIGVLRRFRCHDIVLLDDVVGSGQRIEGFLSQFLAIDTFRSWRSFGWVKFHVVAFAVSHSGEERIKSFLSNRKSHPRCKGVEFHYVQRLPPSTRPWTEQQESDLRALCRVYGQRGGISPQDREGHQRSMSTLVFEHGCPNNAPGILWEKTRRWKPLFPDRAIPPGLLVCFDEELSQGIYATPFEELIKADTSQVRRAIGQAGVDFLLVLSAIAKKLRQLNDIADATGLSTRTVWRMVQLARACDLLNAANILTEMGRSELQCARRLGNLPDEPPALQDDAYFPSSLRAAKRTS
ncbi:hypothetical protein [Vitiosangium sp. GDMCC 1.1324]|uniref:phosphoribosyltransferase-like protein n=1 Tax=Vitiosangium sp. (strain GDMCC 1.1324) TaxID=2138576 RepID=UPI00130E5B6A|nr:hypothetical protein [Vitiosangium sp. GDMCC 1.1324]